MSGLRKKKWPEKATADVGGHSVEVAVKVHARAKHYRLSIAAGGKPILTVPPYGQWREAAGFLRRQTGWLEARLKHAPDSVRFIDGAVIPVRGDDHLIVMADRVRGLVEIIEEEERPVLLVPGGRAHMARRLTDWLKAEAQRDVERAVTRYARRLGVKPTGLTLRAQTTRWGSCSSEGKLSFNWRLILAPSYVLDYVAAHEVAHILEMNHSQAFWDVVGEALPSMERGKQWLQVHGRQLMVYGLED